MSIEPLHIGHGSAKGDDSAAVGKKAAESAYEDAQHPSIVFVFSSEKHANPEFLEAVNTVFPDTEVIGCSTGGEIHGTKLMTGGAVVMAVEGDMRVRVGVGQDISTDERAAGRTAARTAVKRLGNDTLVINELHQDKDQILQRSPTTFSVFSTALTGNASEVLRGVVDVIGRGAQVTGGLAGDDWQLKETYVYHNDTVYTDAIILAAIHTNYVVATGVSHGMVRTANQYTVTKAEDNIVYELDGTPAVEVYKDLFGAKGATPQFLMTKPLGIEVGEDEPRLRDPLDVQDDGSIVYAAEVQEGSIVTIMDSPAENIIEAARSATSQALTAAGNPDPEQVKGVILYDCVCRWHCLNDEETRQKELEAVTGVIGEEVPIIGCYTYGEIALPRALAGVHNQTLVVQVFIED